MNPGPSHGPAWSGPVCCSCYTGCLLDLCQIQVVLPPWFAEEAGHVEGLGTGDPVEGVDRTSLKALLLQSKIK